MRLAFIYIGVLLSTFAMAQNDPLLSHYMINPLVNHPGWAAEFTESHASVQVRSQWTGYNPSFDANGGAPNTQFINVLFTSEGPVSGLGVVAVNDNLGPLNNLYVDFPVARKIKVGFGSVSIGVSPGLISQTQKFNELRFNDPSDPFNIGTRETQVGFNLGAGVVYTTRKNTFISLSASNLLEPGFDYGFADSLRFDNSLNRSFTLLAGTELNLNRNIRITPNVQIRSDLNTFTFDIGGLLKYKERGWAGLSYRWEEAVTLLFGYSFLEGNKLRVGYAFDYVINEREAKQATSQEIFVRYALPNLVFGGRKQVKTPRFTY